MKRIISFIMALALVFTMSIPVFATDAGKGSITITNATIGEKYNLYKVFDATIAVDEDGNPVIVDNKPVISYTIDTKVEDSEGNLVDNPLFVEMFGSETAPSNPYFTFLPVEGENKGNVSKVDTATKEAIQTYLDGLFATGKYAPVYPQPVEANSQTVVFDNLDYGYYMLDKENGTTVSLTSTTPHVNIIDKNQIPGSGFEKRIWDEDFENSDGTKGAWVENTTANVGDILEFKIDFEATNYHGEKPVKYYTVKDKKGSSLWVEFNDITVKLLTGLEDDPDTPEDESLIELDKGYYHYAADTAVTENTNEWEFFGTGWTDAEKSAEKKEDFADWYLIHKGYDEFDIVIPWLEDHNFTGTTNDFTLEYGENATSKYPSPVTVVVEYTASVEPSATIGQQQNNTLWNTAYLTWTAKDKDPEGPPEGETTNVTVYALGLTKTDDATGGHLAGAVFELYREAFDADGKSIIGDPVYVIPTDVDGIYIVDDLNTVVSGNKRESARVTYKAYLADYLGADYETTKAQKNVLTTEVNGKFLVKGLEAGNYYLKETKAPDGYNLLPTPKLIAVGATNNTFTIIADANGNVYDEDTASGEKTNKTYTATSTTVPNSKGVELPSTGGEGAMRLITFGAIIAIAFAALLITHKKMTVYED